jgi:hypothetical protein
MNPNFGGGSVARKTINEKAWFEVEADGRVIGVFEDSAAGQCEMKRLEGYLGISIRKATPQSLMRFGAKTIVPKHLRDRWAFAWEELRYRQEKERLHEEERVKRLGEK